MKDLFNQIFSDDNKKGGKKMNKIVKILTIFFAVNTLLGFVFFGFILFQVKNSGMLDQLMPFQLNESQQFTVEEVVNGVELTHPLTQLDDASMSEFQSIHLEGVDILSNYFNSNGEMSMNELVEQLRENIKPVLEHTGLNAHELLPSDVINVYIYTHCLESNVLALEYHKTQDDSILQQLVKYDSTHESFYTNYMYQNVINDINTHFDLGIESSLKLAEQLVSE